jgi:hypothetical protein
MSYKINRSSSLRSMVYHYTCYEQEDFINPFVLEYPILCFRKSRIIHTFSFRCLFCLKFICKSFSL